MDLEYLKATLKGSLKSWTVWFSSLLLALPEILPLVQSNFATIAPFIPESLHSRVLQLIALIMLVLRLRTTRSLAEKGKPTA